MATVKFLADYEKEMHGQEGELKELQMNNDNKKVHVLIVIIY